MWIGYYEAMVTNGPLVKTTLPTITFNDSMWIHGTKRSIVLVEYKKGHTQSDAVVILPKQGIAFMGDLLFEKRHPYLGHGNPFALINILDKMYADTSLHQFVPGHGNISGKLVVKEISNYVSNVQQLVQDAVQKNQPDSVIKKIAIPAAYADWKFGQFFGFNVNFLLKQAKGNK